AGKMSQSKGHRKKVQDYLNVPEVRLDLHQQLRDRQDHVVMSIKEAATIVDIDENKLRDWEKKNMLQRPPGSKRSMHRRYSVRDIARSLIIKKLLVDQQYPHQEIIDFMQQNTQFIDELVDDIISVQQVRSDLDSFSWAQEAFFWRIFVSRSLYLAMRPLFEQIPDDNVWLLLPLTVTSFQTLEESIQSIDQLGSLGEVLQGSYSDKNPFFMSIPRKPAFDLPKRYKMLSPAWSLASERSPVGVYVLFDEKDERHWKKNDECAIKGAGRLLRLLQDTHSQWKPYLQEGNDFMLYDAPEFEKASLGRHTMDKIADQIVQLGGINSSSQQLRWSFCCILLPPMKDIHLPVKQRHLLVQGQSSASPYIVNKTGLS